MSEATVNSIVEQFEQGLTLDGKKRVIEDHKELGSGDLIQKAKPEEYTKIHLIKPILEVLGCNIDTAERIFDGPRGIKREIDYTFTSKDGSRYILEAKPLNADLFDSKSDGAVNQIMDAMKLYDVVKEFTMGVATDGWKWIFINSERKIVANLNIENHLITLIRIFSGELRPEFDKEEISRKFYKWYSALIYGGKYEDHEGKTRAILRKDCLVESIENVPDEIDRERIAQTVVDRLVFIKFLESKGIIKERIIQYLFEVPDDQLNSTMKSLFFEVMNTEPSKRGPVNPKFKNIPYLNGGLFIRNGSEAKFTSSYDYWIRTTILREVFKFLDSFTFTNKTGDATNTLDPEILGYIFEMSMVSTDRKGTGAFYTPREITMFMSKEAIHKCFISKVRDYLIKAGYNAADVGLINTVEDVYKLSDIRLAELFGEVLEHIRVCDNACGSGAFLLAAADVLFDIYYNVNAKSGLSNSDVSIKKVILAQNIFGVDLNANAVEIAKLRMWLWVVDSYKPGYVEALPNIDYNVRVGDSLIGYTSIKDKLKTTISLDDFGAEESTVEELLKEREGLITKYRSQSGPAARSFKERIDNISRKISGKLSNAMYGKYASDLKCDRVQFFSLSPLHWGLEFSEVFEEGGFDVIVGNPPYIHLEDMKDRLAYKCYEHTPYQTFVPKGDIYQLFYERSNQILREGGILSYITSNSWMKAKYGKVTRQFFIKHTEPELIIDLADLKIFKSATVEANIFSYESRKQPLDRKEIEIPSCVLSDDSSLSDIHTYFDSNKMLSKFTTEDVWTVASVDVNRIMCVMKKHAQTIKEMGISIRYGIKSGCNDAFIIDESTKDKIEKQNPQSSKIIRPVLRGRDLQQYHHANSNLWIILSGYGNHEMIQNDYPAIYNHLLQFESSLKKRGQCTGKTKEGNDFPGQHHWLELDNNPSSEYIRSIMGNKIAWIDLADRGRFCIVEPGTVLMDTAFFFSIDDPYFILGILNSTPVTWYFEKICATSGAGTNRWKKQYVEQIPIPTNPSNRKVIEELVKMLVLNPDDTSVTNQLDREVCKAYGLTEDDMKIIMDT